MNEPDPEELLEEIASLQGRLRSLREPLDARIDANVKSMGGELFDRMSADTNFAIECLNNAGYRDRVAALYILQKNQGASELFKLLCKRHALCDESTVVRVHALGLLGDCYLGTNDNAVGVDCAKVVMNESEDSAVRLAAYQALIYLRDLAADWDKCVSKLSFPDDVDWEFVKSFLKS